VKGAYLLARPVRGGGFAYSRHISDKLGTGIAAVALRWGLHPSLLTIANLLTGLAGSTLIVLSADRYAVNWAVVTGVVLWQMAYLLDCADGQVARASGKATPYGARLDVLTDMVVQSSVLVALSEVVAHWSHPPVGVLVAFAALWPINFATFLLSKQAGLGGLIASGHALTDLVKLPRDYGFAILVLGAWAALEPTTLEYPVFAWAALNMAAFFAYIIRDTKLTMQAAPTKRPPAPSQRLTEAVKDH